MSFESLFHKDLIEIDVEYSDKEELFEKISERLLDTNYVKEDFLEALKTREKNYPTGLALDHINIAIPHTDVEHINTPFVYVLRLSKPIEFVQMGTLDQTIESNIIMLLGIKDSKKQVGMLATLMEIYNEENFCREITNAKSSEEIEILIKKRMGEDKYEESNRSVR